MIDRKAKPVRFNGETHPEFGGLADSGALHGITAKVVETCPVDFGETRGWRVLARWH